MANSTTNNIINIYKNNAATIDCSVSGIASLSGYSAIFSVKKDLNETIVISKDGSINDLQITFKLTPTDTSLAPGNYYYDITIDNSTDIYTVLKDSFIITSNVKYGT